MHADPAHTLTHPDVMVVDDESSIRRLTARWLRDAGYRVSVAASADEAVEALAGHAPQVLVLDVRMPGHDGLWLAREVRARHPETALVMISGDPQAGRELALARLGTFDYLSKPFTVDQIIQAVDCGTRWHEARLLELRTAHPTDAAQPPAGPAARPGPLMRSSRAAWAPSGAALSRLLADLVQA